MPVANIRFKNYRGEWEEAPPEGVLALADADPFFPWPYALVHAICNPTYRPTEGFSITTLEQGCPRCVVLQAREPYTLNLTRNWKRFRGTLSHSLMEEHAPPNAVTEVRFYAVMGGEQVHGSIDQLLLYPATKQFTIQDYKFPDEVPNWDRVWSDHEAQVNGYRWLVNNHQSYDDLGPNADVPEDIKEWKARSVGVLYVGQKGPKPLECRRTKYVPTKPGAKSSTKAVKEPYVWEDEEVEAFFIPRIERLKSAFEQYDRTGTLPDYPEGFDAWSAGALHSYSDTVDLCVSRWREGK